jgi:iron complex outermembrane receptor protein
VGINRLKGDRLSRGREARVLRMAVLGVGFCITPGLLFPRSSGAQTPAPEAPPPPPQADPPAAPAPAPDAPPPATENPSAGEAPAAAEPAATEPGAPPSAPVPETTLPAEIAMGPAATVDAADVSDGTMAAEVVVTIDRRRKDLQDYSGTAAAFSGALLSSIGVQNVRNLAVMVPGLQIGSQESGTTIFIRGIGSDNNTELGDPAVALHVDGVYMPRARGFAAMFYDLERVEVNSGPQGTLRGRNAVGGTINVVTRQPNLTEFQANAEATFGTYSLRAYEGMVNIPIVSDRLALRVAARSEVHDPHWENAGPLHDMRAPQDQNDYAVRVTAKYQPVEAFDLTLAYDFLHEGGTGTVGANFQAALTRLDEDGNLVPFDPNDVDDPRRVYMRGTQPSLDSEHQGVRATANLDAGPVSFEALASYRNIDYRQWSAPTNTIAVVPGMDVASINPDTFGPSNQWHVTSDSWIGELRAYAPDSDRLRWTVGGFYFYEDQGAFLGQINDPVTGSAGGEFNMPSTIGWSVAGYADATFDVVDNFRALGGVRVTRDHKDRKGGFWGLWNQLPPAGFAPGIAPPNTLGRYGTEGFRYKGFDRPSYFRENEGVEARVNLFLDGIASFGARDEVPIALCNDPPAAAAGEEQQPRIALNEDGNWRCTRGIRSSLLGATTPAEGSTIFNWVPQNNEVDNTFVDYRAGVEYDLQKDNLLYATFSTGHKAAGFNDTQAFAEVPVYNSEYGPESVHSLELGSKNLLLDRKLKLNASAFYFGYQGMQFQTIVTVAPDDDPTDNNLPPTSAVRQNAKKRTDVFGMDLDAAYSLPAGLQVELHALLMDARFSDGTIVNDNRLNFGAGDASVDLGGNWLPRASPYTLNYTLSQLIFTDSGAFNWLIQGQTRGTHYMTVFNGDGTRLVRPAPTFDLDNPNYAAAQASVQRFTDVVPTYTVINLGAGWKHPDGRLGISGFVNNAFDIAYATPIVSTAGTNIRYFNPPRVVGLRVRVDW